MATTPSDVTVIGGVDTHKHTHHAGAIDDQGRLLGHREFAATDDGYCQLLAWMRSHGDLRSIGVESTGSFGATLTRYLTAAGVEVIEVNRENRLARRMDGKSDRLDAEQIPGGPRADLDRGPQDQVRHCRGHPHPAGGTLERGQGSHPGVQHPVGRHDRRPLAAARRAGRADQENAGQPLFATASRDRRPVVAGR